MFPFLMKYSTIHAAVFREDGFQNVHKVVLEQKHKIDQAPFMPQLHIWRNSYHS